MTGKYRTIKKENAYEFDKVLDSDMVSNRNGHSENILISNREEVPLEDPIVVNATFHPISDNAATLVDSVWVGKKCSKTELPASAGQLGDLLESHGSGYNCHHKSNSL